MTLADQLQGWGTALAVAVALFGMWLNQRQRNRDQEEQLEQRKRELIVAQIQRVSDIFSELRGLEDYVYAQSQVLKIAVAQARLRGALMALPPGYGCLLKGRFTPEAAVFTGVDQAEVRRRLDVHGTDRDNVPDFMIYMELGQNINDQLGVPYLLRPGDREE